GADSVTNAELLELPCDVLIPAAIENQISGANADRLRCRLLVEGANGPTDLEADAILIDRGVHVVPDILANAGGVTVSYFEWLQSSQQLVWTEEEVNSRLIELMQQAYRRVHEASETRGLDMRGAALQLSIERIAAAKRTRGVFP
ncbi:MAG: glutamate dehydrogenase, partial [Deltaproteobacteria bacterium]|nr:glutamate dehydrogenase [Deltaproteobacteria bacterium]